MKEGGNKVIEKALESRVEINSENRVGIDKHLDR
jgi:hypothetical protein